MRTRRPADAIDHISKDAVRDSATNIIPAGTVIIATRIGLGKVIRVPFDGGFEDGGFVAFEVSLNPLEIRDGFVEAGELFFNLRNDGFLLV